MDDLATNTTEGADGYLYNVPFRVPQDATVGSKWLKAAFSNNGSVPEDSPPFAGNVNVAPTNLGVLRLSDDDEPASPTNRKLAGKHSILSPTSVFGAGV